MLVSETVKVAVDGGQNSRRSTIRGTVASGKRAEPRHLVRPPRMALSTAGIAC